MPSKKQKVMPKVAELKHLMRAFWHDAFEMKTGFEEIKDEEIEGQFGRFPVLENRVDNLIAQLRELRTALRGKEA